ncbi:MAG: hypothetical protein JST22_02020 [Bacteroidetes bacterium]|nr:hypothetical protein [Bacteroidota bacterium]
MKRILIAVVCLCALTHVACDQNGGGTASPESPHGVNGKGGGELLDFSATIYVTDAGTMHNDGMAYLLSTFPFESTFSSNTKKADAMLADICGYFQRVDGWDSTEFHTTYLRDSIAAMFNSNYLADPLAWWDRVRNSNPLPKVASAADLAFVDSVRQIFGSNYSNMTKAQICDRIASRVDALILQYNAATWQVPAGGELAGGLLYLMKGSTSYWKSRDTMIAVGNPNPDGIQYGIAADCLGYITGWLSAAWDDFNSSTGIRPEGQRRRIGQGVIWGLSASAAVFFVHAQQLGIDYH